LADPALIAPAIAWLLSPAAANVTGQSIRFSGRELSLIRRPSLSDSSREADAWTPKLFAEALSALTWASPR